MEWITIIITFVVGILYPVTPPVVPVATTTPAIIEAASSTIEQTVPATSSPQIVISSPVVVPTQQTTSSTPLPQVVVVAPESTSTQVAPIIQPVIIQVQAPVVQQPQEPVPASAPTIMPPEPTMFVQSPTFVASTTAEGIKKYTLSFSTNVPTTAVFKVASTRAALTKASPQKEWNVASLTHEFEFESFLQMYFYKIEVRSDDGSTEDTGQLLPI